MTSTDHGGVTLVPEALVSSSDLTHEPVDYCQNSIKQRFSRPISRLRLSSLFGAAGPLKAKRAVLSAVSEARTPPPLTSQVLSSSLPVSEVDRMYQVQTSPGLHPRFCCLIKKPNTNFLVKLPVCVNVCTLFISVFWSWADEAIIIHLAF